MSVMEIVEGMDAQHVDMNRLEETTCRVCRGVGRMNNSSITPLPERELVCGQCNGRGIVFRWKESP